MSSLRTTDLPDEVVNQRLLVSIYLTADGTRRGSFAIGAWLDRNQSPELPFTPDDGSFRPVDSLSPDDRRYVAAAVLQALQMLWGSYEPDDEETWG